MKVVLLSLVAPRHYFNFFICILKYSTWNTILKYLIKTDFSHHKRLSPSHPFFLAGGENLPKIPGYYHVLVIWRFVPTKTITCWPQVHQTGTLFWCFSLACSLRLPGDHCSVSLWPRGLPDKKGVFQTPFLSLLS